MIAELRLSVICQIITATITAGIIGNIKPLIVARDLLPSFSMIIALKMITPIFATSAGCSCIGRPGMRIQRFAPLTSIPKGMTRTISPTETRYASTDTLFQNVYGMKDTPVMSTSPNKVKTSWRFRKYAESPYSSAAS